MRSGAGRPRGFDEDEVVGRAADLFWRRGLRATTTRDLERDLGVGQSSLYHVFGSKHRLLMAALERYERGAGAQLLEPLERSPAGLDAVAAFFDALAEWVTGPGRGGCLIVNLMAEDGGANEEIAARTDAFRGRLRAALRSGLVRAAALGEIDEGTVEWRAELLVVAVMGLDVLARGGGARSDVAGQVAALRQLIDSWRTT